MGLINEIEDFFEGKKEAASKTPAAPAANVPAPAPGSAQPQGAAVQAVIPGRTLLVHGYSASGTEFLAWKDALVARGIATATIEIGNYISLNNEITIKDLGEAFDRALRLTPWSTRTKDDLFTFDAVVHSTGMLVLRQWLASDPFPRSDPRSRVRRLKHLVGLAPATFGSPQGKKGRSWLGALVKGNKDLGPDFLNAGDMVLDGLELASKYTWELAQKDMLCDPPMYAQGDATPYVAVFIGNTPYTGLAKLASGPGTDGTVRWAGCALNTRMVQLDFRRESKLVGDDGKPARARISKWEDDRLACPMLAVDERNHGTILSSPVDDVVQRVSDFLLNVKSDPTYSAWLAAAQAYSKEPQATMDAASFAKDPDGNQYGGAGWQQFVLHVIDDHGDGVDDYNVQLYVGKDLSDSDDKNFPSKPLIADTYSGDASYRCFYVRLDDDMLSLGTPGSKKKVWMELIAASGTAYLDYEAYYNMDQAVPDAEVQRLTQLRQVVDPATAVPNLVKLDLTDLGSEATLFYPYTTTLVEIVIEREPTPLQKVSDLFQFWQGDQTKNS
jgi:hypothetical protein